MRRRMLHLLTTRHSHTPLHLSLGGMFDPNDPVPHWTTGTMRRVASEPSLADAALRYANLGVPVFPCVPGGKQPLTPNGHGRA